LPKEWNKNRKKCPEEVKEGDIEGMTEKVIRMR
jgi:hypothetical protein